MREIFAALLFLAFFILEIFLGSLFLWAFQDFISSKPLTTLKPTLLKSVALWTPLLVMFLALCLGISHLFPWTTAKATGDFRHFYLSRGPFLIRNLVYFLIWGGLSYRLSKTKPIKAPFMMILVGLTATFVSIDWILSLDSHYHSSAFGVVFFMSCPLTAFCYHLRKLPLPPPEPVLVQLNSIHLTLIASWAYVTFMEYLVVWFGNIPTEASWFVSRTQTNWKVLGILLILFQFLFPVALLFFRVFKKSFSFTRKLALVTISMQALYLFWLIFPSLWPGGFPWGLP
ncbi:MAG: hypothetical protein ACXWRE_14740 [Pseudobdellovibrionaceae bacterium]